MHPKLIENINERLESLKLSMVPIPDVQSKATPTQRRESDIHVDATITEQDIIGGPENIKITQQDGIGNKTGFLFLHNGKKIGIVDNSFRELTLLAEKIQKDKEYRSKVSVDTVRDHIFEWLKAIYSGKTNQEFVQYLEESVEKSVKNIEVWVPISELVIQNSFSFGNVIFKPMTKATIDSWEQILEETHSDNAKLITDKIRKSNQGYAVGSITLEAEENYASEYAFESVEIALAILRFFAPASVIPELTSYCLIRGYESVDSQSYFIFNEDTLHPPTSMPTNVVGTTPQPWVLGNEVFKLDVFHKLSNLLSLEKKSKFQEKLLDTLLIFSKLSIAKSYADKLLSALFSIEAFLLRNESEPIQQNIGERIAFIIEKNPQKRKEVVDNFKQVYKLRSLFVHHGKDLESIETFRIFLMNLWRFYNLMILNMDYFKTMDDLFNHIDEMKFK